MDKEGDERIKVTYQVNFTFSAIDIPTDIGNFNDAMYQGHKQFKDWLELGESSMGIISARFPYTVLRITSAEKYEDGVWNMKYEIKETLTGFDTGLKIKYEYDGKKHYSILHG